MFVLFITNCPYSRLESESRGWLVGCLVLTRVVTCSRAIMMAVRGPGTAAQRPTQSRGFVSCLAWLRPGTSDQHNILEREREREVELFGKIISLQCSLTTSAVKIVRFISSEQDPSIILYKIFFSLL